MLSPPHAGTAARQARFEAVYASCRTPILGYALRRTGSPDDAADVVAETFLVAWRRLEEIPAGQDTRLWLYGVARNVVANFYRGERRRTALADRLRAELAEAYNPPQYDGESARIAAALRRLPDDQREILALNAWEGLDYGQLATVLGCSRNAVRIRLHRARARLAAELARPGTRPAVAGLGGGTASGDGSTPTAAGPDRLGRATRPDWH